MKILICRPNFYKIDYSINPWMAPQTNQADSNLAIQQWEKLKELIMDAGGEPVEVDPVEGWPDMVFTANAGLIKDKKFVLSKFAHSERSGEEPHFRKFFEDNGYEVLDVEENFEGAGDALFFKDVLFAGFGFRTEKTVHKRLRELLGIETIISCRLMDPYFYHLDTCFCPLDDKRALFWPRAFDEWMVEDADHYTDIKLLAVPSDESRRFACNAVVINDTVIIPSNCPGTKTILNREGFKVLETPMTEFIKAGGACKCLTLKM
jgi:N-dimethylarginine dimethylaminohydrolase